MPQKSGLGRGLGALIPSGEKVQLENSVMLVPVEMVLPNPRQPRRTMQIEELEELKRSNRSST